MSEFYVRVTPTYAFSREHLPENGAFYDRLTDTLSESLSVMLHRKRYTFAFYSATADSRAACRKAAFFQTLTKLSNQTKLPPTGLSTKA